MSFTGIMDNMVGTGWSGYEALDQVAIMPQLPRLYGFDYLVRTEPGRRNAIMRTVEALAVFGPRAFGLAEPFQPIETLT